MDNYSYLHRYRSVFLFLLFFLICFGLGYQTMNRYDPRNAPGLYDTTYYFALVESWPNAEMGQFQSRVVIPFLAKQIARLAEGHIGTWNAVAFALLVVNSALVAASALLILILGKKTIGDYIVSLSGSLFFLLSFAVVNYQLCGMVDSGEICLLLVSLLVMLIHRWSFLPLLGIVGALTKETFVPLSLVFATVYCWVESTSRSRLFNRLVWIGLMGISGLATVTTARLVISGQMLLPWDIVTMEKATQNFMLSFLHCIRTREMLYTFIWLLPLGIIRLKDFPKPWVYGSLASTFMVLVLGSWNEAGSNVFRPVFNTMGPLLSLSAAYLVCSLKSSGASSKVKEE